jgi:hypothetical protein
MQILSKYSMEMERQKFEFLVCLVFRFQNLGEVRVELHKPSFVDEGVTGIRSGSARPKV